MADIEVNANHYNLAGVSALVDRMVKDTDLGGYLYVYGLEDNYDYDYYLDPELGEGVEQLCGFLNNVLASQVRVELVTNPRNRPCLGITRRARENIEDVVKVCGLVFLLINGRLDFNE